MAKSDLQRDYEKFVLKSKPKGISAGEALSQGSTAKWSRGKYRKQAEAQEEKEHKAYRKDNPSVKKGQSPIEGTKEEYVRRNQVQDKLNDYNSKNKKKVSSTTSKPSAPSKKKTASRKIATKR